LISAAFRILSKDFRGKSFLECGIVTVPHFVGCLSCKNGNS